MDPRQSAVWIYTEKMGELGTGYIAWLVAKTVRKLSRFACDNYDKLNEPFKDKAY